MRMIPMASTEVDAVAVEMNERNAFLKQHSSIEGKGKSVGNIDFDKIYPITQEPMGAGFNYHVYLLGSIGPAWEFAEVLALLDQAQHGDRVTFVMHGPGGYASVAVMLIDAIRHCEALVVAECAGLIASADTMIALACAGLYVSDNIEFMLHNYSGGIYGKGHEIQANADFDKVHYPALMRDYYQDFLTEDELDRLIKGEDFYFGTEEVQRRWQIVAQARRDKLEVKELAAKEIQIATMIEMVSSSGYVVSPIPEPVKKKAAPRKRPVKKQIESKAKK